MGSNQTFIDKLKGSRDMQVEYLLKLSSLVGFLLWLFLQQNVLIGLALLYFGLSKYFRFRRLGRFEFLWFNRRS